MNALSSIRFKLKLELARTRTVFTTDGYKPRCAYCNEPVIFGAPEMHEVFLTRGDTYGREDIRALTMVRQNCVLVHPHGCHTSAATKEGHRRCAAHLIRYESGEKILWWMSEIKGYFRGIRVIEESNLVKELMEIEDAKRPNPPQSA